MSKNKKCQYCASKILKAANYCTNCEKEQHSIAILVERTIKLELWSYIPMFFSLIPFVLVSLWTMQAYDVLREILSNGLPLFGYIFLLILSYPTVQFLISLFSHLISDLYPSVFNASYLVKRIEFKNRVVLRNWILYPSFFFLLTWGMINLYAKRPSENDAIAYLKSHPELKNSKIVEKYECPWFSVFHVLKNKEYKVYLAVWDSFIPVEKNLIQERKFVKHYTTLSK